MTDMNLEKSLREFDYSEFSKVKESLLSDILREMYKDNLKRNKNLMQNFSDELLNDEELDYAVAAGSPFTRQKEKI